MRLARFVGNGRSSVIHGEPNNTCTAKQHQSINFNSLINRSSYSPCSQFLRGGRNTSAGATTTALASNQLPLTASTTRSPRSLTTIWRQAVQTISDN